MINFEPTRVGAIAMAVLMIGTFAAQAADSEAQQAQDDCMNSVQLHYSHAYENCIKNSKGGKKLNLCLARIAKVLADQTANCLAKYPTFQFIDQGVGGPTSTGLDGWHPKGPKTEGLIDPATLNGADTSGGHGVADNGDGGSNGGPKGFKGTFNSSMAGASMSTGGGSGGIIQ